MHPLELYIISWPASAASEIRVAVVLYTPMSADVHCRLGSELGFRVTAGQSARWNRLASSGHSAVTVSDTDNTVRIACTGRFHQSR